MVMDSSGIFSGFADDTIQACQAIATNQRGSLRKKDSLLLLVQLVVSS